MAKKAHCPGCNAIIPPWLLACKACYLQAPRHLRDALREEYAHCKSLKLAHTDRLLDLRLAILGHIQRLAT